MRSPRHSLPNFDVRCWMFSIRCSPLHPVGVRPRRAIGVLMQSHGLARVRRRMGFGSYKGEVVVLFLWAGAPAPANVCCVVAGVRGAGLCRRSAARSRKAPPNRLPLRCYLVAHLYRCATRFTDDQEGAGAACPSAACSRESPAHKKRSWVVAGVGDPGGGSAGTPWSAQACLRLVRRSLLRRVR